MKRDKKALYESIMASVAKEVKKALNEGEYPEVYTNERGQKIDKSPDSRYEINEIGLNIAKIIKENLPERQLQVMLNAITDGVYLDHHVSPIFAINAILYPLCYRTIDKDDL